MPKMQLLSRYDDTKDEAVILVRDANTGEGKAIELANAELEATILQLARIRAAMKDEVPSSLEPNPRLGGLHNPIWQANLATFESGIVKAPALAYRHPGLGWQTIHLSPDEARKLGTRLIELA